MSLRELASCPAAVCVPTTSVQEAATLMARHGVGLLVVVDGDRPVGVVTDRDIVLRAVAAGKGDDVTVAEVMTPHAATVDEEATVEEAARLMADKQCRRVGVTDDDGRIIGVLSLDDVVHAAGTELQYVARAVHASRRDRLGLP